MSFHHFPHEFVYWDKVENHDEIKKELLPIILEKNKKIKNNPFNACILNTSFYSDEKHFTENEFLRSEKMLENVIFYHLEKMIKNYNSLNLNKIYDGHTILEGSWWNVYNKNEYQEAHAHMGEPIYTMDKFFYPSFSMVYILNDENDKSALTFKKSGPLSCAPSFVEHIFRTCNVKDIKEGSILIFPSNLLHLVEPCLNAGRVTLTYNFYSTFRP